MDSVADFWRQGLGNESDRVDFSPRLGMGRIILNLTGWFQFKSKVSVLMGRGRSFLTGRSLKEGGGRGGGIADVSLLLILRRCLSGEKKKSHISWPDPLEMPPAPPSPPPPPPPPPPPGGSPLTSVTQRRATAEMKKKKKKKKRKSNGSCLR